MLLLSAASAAQAQAGNKAAAEALFEEGRRLMSASQFAEACAKFEGSQALDPAVGTSLNLADCYEKTGRSASAWAQFRETVAAAHRAGSLDRERIARERADALAPKLSYLTIIARCGQDVVVTRDGVPIGAAELGSAIPVDAGAHVVAASAPNKRPWSTTVQVGTQADRVSVSVPPLEDAPKPELPAPVVGVESEQSAEPATAAARSDAADPGSTQRVIAIVAAAVGVAGLATGTVFGIKASSTWNEAKAGCHPYPHCSADAHEQSLDAQRSGTISTIAFVAGGVGVAAGTLLWLTAPRREGSQVSVDVGPGSVGMHGSF